MTMRAPRLVRPPAADHDGGALPRGGPAVDETLVAARRPAANYTDRLKLVDDLGDGEERGHRTERQAAEIHVDPRQHDSNAAVGEPGCGGHDAVIPGMDLVERDHLRVR